MDKKTARLRKVEPPSQPEQNVPLNTLKRRSIIIALLLGVVALLVGWVVEAETNRSDSFDAFIHPATGLLLGALALTLWLRKDRLHQVELIGLGGGAMFFIIKLLYIFYFGSDNLDVIEEFQEFASWMPAIYIGAFLIYDRQEGLSCSMTFYGTVLVIGLPYMLVQMQMGGIEALNTLVQFYLSNGAIVALLYTFAHVRDQYTRAQTRAEALELLATRDFLTGLPNRRLLHETLVKEIGKVKRHQRSFSIILFDLDHFKSVNDTFGHETGDNVLKEVAGLMAQQLRAGDMLARWGGEEFLILCPETEGAQAIEIAERLKQTLENYLIEHVGTITASFGVTSHIESDTPDSLLKRADEALYRAKAKGRNRVDVVPPVAPEPARQLDAQATW